MRTFGLKSVKNNISDINPLMQEDAENLHLLLFGFMLQAVIEEFHCGLAYTIIIAIDGGDIHHASDTGRDAVIADDMNTRIDLTEVRGIGIEQFDDAIGDLIGETENASIAFID